MAQEQMRAAHRSRRRSAFRGRSGHRMKDTSKRGGFRNPRRTARRPGSLFRNVGNARRPRVLRPPRGRHLTITALLRGKGGRGDPRHDEREGGNAVATQSPTTAARAPAPGTSEPSWIPASRATDAKNCEACRFLVMMGSGVRVPASASVGSPANAAFLVGATGPRGSVRRRGGNESGNTLVPKPRCPVGA